MYLPYFLVSFLRGTNNLFWFYIRWIFTCPNFFDLQSLIFLILEAQFLWKDWYAKIIHLSHL